jgi:hypothetical protein
MNEKMYDFEEKKRNNLVFYGIPETEGGETDDILDRKINQVPVINMMSSKGRRKIRFIHSRQGKMSSFKKIDLQRGLAAGVYLSEPRTVHKAGSKIPIDFISSP